MILTNKKSATIVALGLLLMGAGVAPVKAATNTDVTDSVSAADTNQLSDLQKALRAGDPTKVKTVAQAMISDRLKIMQQMITDIQSFKHVSSDDKNTLTGEVQMTIAAFLSLYDTIGHDAAATTTVSSALRTDATSITKNYRVGVLFHPQVGNLLAADRIETLYTLFTDLETKLQSRITAMNGVNDTAAKTRAQAALDDMKQHVENANGAAIKAEASIVGLKPDQGDKNVLDANNAALAAAKTQLQGATKDLVAARKDVDTIVAILKGKR